MLMRSHGKKITLAILGANGLVGSDLVTFFEKKYRVFSITKSNYENSVGRKYDILINANGNSRRFWANKNPLDDFIASTVSVYKSILDFPCSLYIYISSPDVYNDHSSTRTTKEDQTIVPTELQPYGFHKYMGELLVKNYKKHYFILRTSMMLGTKLRKGPIFDIQKGNPLYISRGSSIQLITAKAFASIIDVLMKKHKTNEVFNVGGTGTFAFSGVQKYFHQPIRETAEPEAQKYEMNISKIKHIYPELKSSEAYLREYLLR